MPGFLWKLAFALLIRSDVVGMRVVTGMRVNHARAVVNSRRQPLSGSQSRQIKVALHPPGRYVIVDCSSGEIGSLKEGGEDIKPIVLDCPEGKSGFKLYRNSSRSGSGSYVSAGSNIEVCTQGADIMTLSPLVALHLLPDSESPDSTLGADFCLSLSVWAPSIIDHKSLLSVAKSLSKMKGKLQFTKVARSSLLAIESWLFYSGGGQTSDSARAVQDGSLYKSLHDRYVAVGEPVEDLDLVKQIATDLDRWHVFGEIPMPETVTEKDAKDMLSQVIRRRLWQGRTQCWNGKCLREEYAQAYVYIVGSLLAVALQACAEQLEYKIVEVGSTLDPAAVTFELFSRYLDSDIGTFHVPDFLRSRLPIELDAVFGAYFSGKAGTHLFAPVAPPKEQVDLMTRMHMDKIVMQFYPTLAYTASSTAESLDSSRAFWHYFFKSLGYGEDSTVMFHRTSLLLALSGPNVMMRQSSIDIPTLVTKSFHDVLKDWLRKRKLALDDPEAPVSISSFASGLRQSMQAPEGMSVDMFRIGYRCSNDSRLRYKTYQFFSLCRNALTGLRLASV